MLGFRGLEPGALGAPSGALDKFPGKRCNREKAWGGAGAGWAGNDPFGSLGPSLQSPHPLSPAPRPLPRGAGLTQAQAWLPSATPRRWPWASSTP